MFPKFGAKKLTFGAKSRAKPHGLGDLGTTRIKVIYKKKLKKSGRLTVDCLKYFLNDHTL